MTDLMTIVADTLRTMMGATAAEPYIRAIERAVEEAHAGVCTCRRVPNGWERNPTCPIHDDGVLLRPPATRARPLDATGLPADAKTGKITTR